ncbi:hypothetical protein FG379_000881 [Cryptosporidium bovis]|uniref:uncharacterized protein n=1 Tax=Cryptosporidium bovis TaxID=310047 RepID=UPI00351A6980|nr:hypothetical protein FG379_000881 [Cryptosporidium bovis]
MHSTNGKLAAFFTSLVLLTSQVFFEGISTSVQVDEKRNGLLDVELVMLPLKNQTNEFQMLPRFSWDELSDKEDESLKQIQDNVILTKSEEYWLIISELEYEMNGYEDEQKILIKMSEEFQNMSKEFEIYNKNAEVQSLLGGNGIAEFNKLEENMRYSVELLMNEIRENQNCINKFKKSLDPYLKNPILDMIAKIKKTIGGDRSSESKNKKIKGYAYSFQLLNIMKERYNTIRSVNRIMEKNHLIMDDTISTFNYIMNELLILINDQLKPILTSKFGENRVNTVVKSGNELIKKAELINSMFSNTVFIKYGKIDELTSGIYSNVTVEDVGNELKKNNIKLIKEFELVPPDYDSRIETSERLVMWETDISLSIRNILEGSGVSELFKGIDNDIKNIEIVDLNEKLLNKIKEIDNKLYKLTLIESEIKTMWYVFNYLKKDELLLNYNDDLKYIIENEELNVDNQERITYIYNQLTNAKSEYQILYFNNTNEDNIETHFNNEMASDYYSSLKTLMCLDQFYRIKQEVCDSSQECESKSNYLHYSQVNEECVNFLVDKIKLFETKRSLNGNDNSEEHKKGSRYVIEYFISLIFPNKEKRNYLENHTNSPIWCLIQELNEEKKMSLDSNENEYGKLLIRKRDRVNRIVQMANDYNERSKLILSKVDSVLNKNETTEEFNQVKEYMEKMDKVLRKYIFETISNKEDIINVFDNIERVLKMILDDLSEKSLSNENMIVSLKSKYDEILFLFNEYTAKCNLKFGRKERIEGIRFLEKTKSQLKEFGDRIEEIKKQIEEVCLESNNNYNGLQQNISLLLSYTHSSRVLLGSEIQVNNHEEDEDNKIISINLRHEDSYVESFRVRYRYILGMIGYYNKVYLDLKRKKQSLLENENALTNKLVQVEKQMRKRFMGKVSNGSEKSLEHDTNRVRRQRKIAERLLNGYLMLNLKIYNSKSSVIKNALVALDNVISDYKFQINRFKRENNIGKQIKFKTKLMNLLNIKKFYKARKYYNVMKSFDEYIMQKREQFFEYLEYSDKTINRLNNKTLEIIDFYLCKSDRKGDKHETMVSDEQNNAGVNFNDKVIGLGKLVSKLEPIQILIGDLYSIFYRLGKVENHNNIYYLESISKLLFDAVNEYEKLNKNVNKVQKKTLNLYLKQQVVIENIINLIKLILPAAYFIRNYNKIPSEYLNYKSKYGSKDIMDNGSFNNNHINIKGWNINKGKSNIHLENLLAIQRRYINSEEEFYKMKTYIDEQIENLTLLPVDVNINKYIGNTAIFLISDELLEQITFELERNDLAFSNEKIDNISNKKTTVMGSYIEGISKKRKELHNKLISKSLIVKQGKCSDNHRSGLGEK